MDKSIFIHDIEDVVKALGARKDNVKRALLSNFQCDVDFVMGDKPDGALGRPRTVIFISEACRRQLNVAYALKCRKDITQCDGVAIDFVKRYLPKETETLDFIERALARNFRCSRQHNVHGTYRVDMFFPDQRVAVECDEFGHAGRNSESEDTRQAYIERELNCLFIRFNPDAAAFDLAELVSTIIDALIHR